MHTIRSDIHVLVLQNVAYTIKALHTSASIASAIFCLLMQFDAVIYEH
jgi:hypothetical protein